MSWRERLAKQRAGKIQKGSGDQLTKPTKGAFVSFVSTPDGYSGKIAVPCAPAVRADIRPGLQVLADRLGLDRAIVHRLTTADIADCAGFPAEARRIYLLMLDAAATRWIGKVPEGDTATIHCAHCGPVFAHPNIAAVLPVVDGLPRALGCPWCFIRKAGLRVPRPEVTCSICEHFQRGLVNSEGGMGRCVVGAASPHDPPTYPSNPRRCGSWCPRKIDDE